MPTVAISLPDSLKEFVDAQVANRGFENVSDYLNSLVREAQDKADEVRLNSLLLEGLASGDDIELSEEFWNDLKREALAIGPDERAPGKS